MAVNKVNKRKGRVAVFRCVVDMYGISHQISGLRTVEIELSTGASLADLIAGLKREIPALEGPVIHPGEKRLNEQHVFNINGRFYFDDSELQLKDGDRVALLTLAISG